MERVAPTTKLPRLAVATPAPSETWLYSKLAFPLLKEFITLGYWDSVQFTAFLLCQLLKHMSVMGWRYLGRSDNIVRLEKSKRR